MPEILKALNEGTAGDGGYIVPEQFSSKVLELVQAQTVVVPDLEQVQMTTDTLRIPKVTAGSTAYLVSELGTITSSQLGFGETVLYPKKFAALIEASTELEEDNIVGVADVLVNQMARDLAIKIDNEIFNGEGGTTFAGLRYTGSFTNSVAANGTIGGTQSAAISLTPISKAIDEVLKDNHSQPDVSYFNPRTIGSLRLLTDSTSRPMLNMETWGSPLLREGVIGTLMGTKLKPAANIPVTLTYGSQTGCTDAIVGVSKMFGYYAVRRNVTFKRDYVISTDRNQYQVTLRSAFAVKYPDAYCVIRSITN